jgi:hypothetical protein
LVLPTSPHSFTTQNNTIVFKAVSFLSCLTTRYEGAWGERRYSSYSFSTLALDGGEWSASRPSRA